MEINFLLLPPCAVLATTVAIQRKKGIFLDLPMVSASFSNYLYLPQHCTEGAASGQSPTFSWLVTDTYSPHCAQRRRCGGCGLVGGWDGHAKSCVHACNGSSDSTEFIHQCDQNFNDSQIYISAVNLPLAFMFSVRRQMLPVSARRVAFVFRDFPIGFIQIISNDFTLSHYVRWMHNEILCLFIFVDRVF